MGIPATSEGMYEQNLKKAEAALRERILRLADRFAFNRIKANMGMNLADPVFTGRMQDVADALFFLHVTMRNVVTPPPSDSYRPYFMTKSKFIKSTTKIFGEIREEMLDERDKDADVPVNPPANNDNLWRRRLRYEFLDLYIRGVLRRFSDDGEVEDFYDGAMENADNYDRFFQLSHKGSKRDMVVRAVYLKNVPVRHYLDQYYRGLKSVSGHCNGHNHKPDCQCGWGGPRGGVYWPEISVFKRRGLPETVKI